MAVETNKLIASLLLLVLKSRVFQAQKRLQHPFHNIALHVTRRSNDDPNIK